MPIAQRCAQPLAGILVLECKKAFELSTGREQSVRFRQQGGKNMVDLSISGGNLVLHVRGADKLWALKSSLEIPLVHIAEIRADPSVAHGWWHGLKMPGTNIPGVLTAGTFYQDGKRVFWDVHNPVNTVVIELRDERYNELIVEVADPQAAVEIVKGALPR
jgi:hypothetical protein